MLSNAKAVAAVTKAFVPVVADHYRQVEAVHKNKGGVYDELKKRCPAKPRNPKLFDEATGWGGGIVWVCTPDKSKRAPIDYTGIGTVEEFLRRLDEAMKKIER